VFGRTHESFSALFEGRDVDLRFSAKEGAEVNVIVHPTFLFSYKVSAAADPNQNTCTLRWAFGNPDANSESYPYYYEQDVTINQRATMVVPAYTIGKGDEVTAEVKNLSGSTVTLLAGDASILYGAGGFEMNFVRVGLMVLLGLMFLAALGVFASTWLSFSVACLLSMVALGVGSLLGFLAESIAMGPGRDAAAETRLLYGCADWVYYLMKILLPDLTATMGGRDLVDGMRVPWSTVAEAGLLTMGIRGLLLLSMGCLIFHRRELAQVQV